MKDMEKVNLSEVARGISENKIVLPDFQRGFAWKDKNKQISLIASVLTKLPIGMVLFLEAGTEEYGYKKIGRNERNIVFLEDGKTVKALLDGQQRITTLLAFFSTRLQKNEDLISPTLNRRYFLNLPDFRSVMECGAEDLFGGSVLQFPSALKNGVYPEISCEDVRSRISFVAEKKDFLYEEANQLDTEKICRYCKHFSGMETEEENTYLIPLYYLLEASEDEESNESIILRDIIEQIGEEYKNSIITWIQNNQNSIDEKKCLLDQMGIRKEKKEELINYLMEGEIQRLKKVLGEQLLERKIRWTINFLNYLLNCIRDIKLYEIKVDAKDRGRAIDIYENLNLGGKALSVFDLVLAKSSKNIDEKERGNLLTQIVDYILEDHREEYRPFICQCKQKQKNSYKNNIEGKKISYSASERIGCWKKEKKELSSGYVKALMNLLGVIDYFSAKGYLDLEDQKAVKNVNSRILKKDYLLKIDSEKICKYVRLACKGLDRASVFLQIRCGIRKVEEIHYNLMWPILGTVFLKDEWFVNGDVLSYMEAWYWSSILSGAFRMEQNRAFFYHLQNVLSEVYTLQTEEQKKTFVIGLCNEVLRDKRFADKEILLMKNPSAYPEKILGNIICQYYLADTYEDILKESFEEEGYQAESMEVLNEDLKLEKHHIMPIGSLEAKYKKMNREEDKRQNGNSPYNSPLNFLFISDQANRLISSSSLKEYIGYCNTDTLKEVGIGTWEELSGKEMGFQIGPEELNIFLEKRYSNFEHSLNERFQALLNCKEIKCGKSGVM